MGEEGRLRESDLVDCILKKHMQGSFPSLNFKLDYEWYPVVKEAVKNKSFKPMEYFFKLCCQKTMGDSKVKICSICPLGNQNEHKGWCYEYNIRVKGFAINNWIGSDTARNELRKVLNVLDAIIEVRNGI